MEIRAEQPGDASAVEALLDAAFGAERTRKTAYKIREGLAPLPEISLVMTADLAPAAGQPFYAGADGQRLVAVLRFWPVKLGDNAAPALLLGPLAVQPDLRGQGLGAALMREGLRRAEAAGHRRVVLIGDPAYYARFGFSHTPVAGLTLPAHEAPGRFQGLALAEGAFNGLAGPVLPDRRTAPSGSAAISDQI